MDDSRTCRRKLDPGVLARNKSAKNFTHNIKCIAVTN